MNENNMRWHIVGADGFIGTQLVRYLKNIKSKNMNIIEYSCNSTAKMNYLDLCDENETFFENLLENDYVIFLAAVSSPDVCHNNFEFAYKVNVTRTSIFINKCLNKKSKVLFFSSDVVFGKSKISNNEKSETKPFGEYAEMKVLIEKQFLCNQNFKVFRLSYVFSEFDKFTNYLMKCLKSNETAEVFQGLLRNVIFLEDVLEAVYKLYYKFDTIKYSIFHLCGEELLSRIDMVNIIKKEFDNIKFVIVKEPLDFYDARAYSIEMESLYIKELLDRKVTKFEDAVIKIGESLKRREL